MEQLRPSRTNASVVILRCEGTNISLLCRSRDNSEVRHPENLLLQRCGSAWFNELLGTEAKVATMLNQSAALAGDPPSNPLQWRVITSAINGQDSTMCTLFGNDVAVRYARTNLQHDYPACSALSYNVGAAGRHPLVWWTNTGDAEVGGICHGHGRR